MSTLRFNTYDLPDNIIAAPESLAKYSTVISELREEHDIIHLHSVKHDTMNQIVSWCNSYEITNTFDKDFVTTNELFDIINAAHTLDIQPLLDDACKVVAELIRDKTPEQIRQAFNIVNDFTPEEEQKIRNENEWIPFD